MTQVATNVASLAQLGQIQANVGMQDVAAVFVARHEAALNAQHDANKKALTAAKQALAKHEEQVKDDADIGQFSDSAHRVGVTFSATDVVVVWKKEAGSYHSREKGIHVTIVAKRDKQQIASFTEVLALPPSVSAKRAELMADVETAEANVLETNGLLKQIGTRERAIRGRIAEMQLTQAGFSELLNDESIARLIQLK